jgi:hypothetical protein
LEEIVFVYPSHFIHCSSAADGGGLFGGGTDGGVGGEGEEPPNLPLFDVVPPAPFSVDCCGGAFLEIGSLKKY